MWIFQYSTSRRSYHFYSRIDIYWNADTSKFPAPIVWVVFFLNLFCFPQQLKIASATAILAAFSVWSIPVKSSFDDNGDILPLVYRSDLAKINRVYFPTQYGRSSSFILPLNRVIHSNYKHPMYFQGSYRSPFAIPNHQQLNFLYPFTNGIIRQDLVDINNVMTNELHARRAAGSSFDHLIMPSFDSAPSSRHASFTDKSFLSFLSGLVLPVRFVNRVSSFPNFRVTYKNITLTGLAIG